MLKQDKFKFDQILHMLPKPVPTRILFALTMIAILALGVIVATSGVFSVMRLFQVDLSE